MGQNHAGVCSFGPHGVSCIFKVLQNRTVNSNVNSVNTAQSHARWCKTELYMTPNDPETNRVALVIHLLPTNIYILEIVALEEKSLRDPGYAFEHAWGEGL